MKFILGSDEAGRGPVIGPLVMSIAAIDASQESELKKLGVKDSKLLSIQERESLIEPIHKLCIVETIITTAKQIDEALLDPRRNLNILEEEVTQKLIEKIIKKVGAENIKHAIIDCPSINTVSYFKSLNKRIEGKIKLIVEHKADLNYPIAAAASIIAKTTRDKEIEKLKQKVGINFGSGYPSDPNTATFVRKHYKDYDFFRKTWQTYKNAVIAGQQSTLGSFTAKKINPKTKDKEKQLKELLKKRFVQVEAKGTSEVMRIKKEGVTITLYENGKLLVQGKEKTKWQSYFR